MYKLFPVEPTEKMLEAIRDVCLNTSIGGGSGWLDYARKIYDTALETAPNPSRPIAEAPRDGSPVFVWPSKRIAKHIIGEPWLKDGWYAIHSTEREYPTHFIPLEWLGGPEGGQ